MSNRVSIADVAELAGVQKSTVSKALSGSGNLSPETRERIIKIATETGYLPNRAAQLLSKREKNIGILFQQEPSEIIGLFNKGLKKSIESYEKFGYNFHIENFKSYYDTENFIKKIKILSSQVNGLIFCTTNNVANYIDDIAMLEIPLITLLNNLDHSKYGIEKCYGVSVNEIVVGKLAAEFLSLKAIKPKVAIITGSNDSYIHQKNVEGFISDLDKNHLNLVDISESLDDMRNAYFLTEKIIKETPDIGGIFVTSYVSPGVCEYLKQKGLSGQINVIGVDCYDGTIDCIRDGSLSAIIHQNQTIQAQRAVDNIIETLNGNPMKNDEKIKPELILRSNLDCYLEL